MEGTPFGRYRLVQLLGRGGMGEVWRAIDTETSYRTVAIKLLAPQLAQDDVFVQRFRREADAAARLSNPHIIPIHSYGEIDGRLYVDMRLIEGRDLQEVLAAGPLSAARSVDIVGQIAKALQAAHRVGLVHRDVKPSNILIDDDDFAYLIDFGIAADVTRTKLTRTGMLIGTLAYMAPERFTTGAADAAVDVYALACVLHECLTGVQPYPGDSAEQQISGHLTLEPPRPSRLNRTVPEAFDAVIARGMAKNPAARFSSTNELALAASAVAALPPVPNRVAPPPRQPTWAQQATAASPYAAPPAPPPSAEPARASEPARPQGRGRLVLAAAAIVAFGAAALIGGILIARTNEGTAQRPATPPPVTFTDAVTTSKSAVATSESARTAVSSVAPPAAPPPSPAPTSLPAPTGTDAKGFVGYGSNGARCDAESSPAVMGRTAESVFVICVSDPEFAFYRGVRVSDGAAIELLYPVRSGGGWDVTNPADGTLYRVRPDSLTITTSDGQVFTEPMVQYAALR